MNLPIIGVILLCYDYFKNRLSSNQVASSTAIAIHSFVFFFSFSIFIYVRSELQCEFVVEKMEKPARTWNSSNYLLAGKQNNKL
jgi:hypothetical protein